MTGYLTGYCILFPITMLSTWSKPWSKLYKLSARKEKIVMFCRAKSDYYTLSMYVDIHRYNFYSWRKSVSFSHFYINYIVTQPFALFVELTTRTEQELYLLFMHVLFRAFMPSLFFTIIINLLSCCANDMIMVWIL